MPASEIPIPCNVAEPPQEPTPSGRWADRLRAEFLAAAQDLDQVGEPGEVSFYPDRTWHGYTYIPVSATTANDFQVYGYVRFVAGTDGRDQSDFTAYADFTEETAERNPEWELDLCDEVVGAWRGADGAVASMTLVWGRSLVEGGSVATAELGEHTVDQCALADERFTLLAPDDVAGALLEVRLYSQGGEELARESLYDEDAEGDEAE
jgi:hypothetical protein